MVEARYDGRAGCRQQNLAYVSTKYASSSGRIMKSPLLCASGKEQVARGCELEIAQNCVAPASLEDGWVRGRQVIFAAGWLPCFCAPLVARRAFKHSAAAIVCLH